MISCSKGSIVMKNGCKWELKIAWKIDIILLEIKKVPYLWMKFFHFIFLLNTCHGLSYLISCTHCGYLRGHRAYVNSIFSMASDKLKGTLGYLFTVFKKILNFLQTLEVISLLSGWFWVLTEYLNRPSSGDLTFRLHISVQQTLSSVITVCFLIPSGYTKIFDVQIHFFQI